MQGRRLKLLFFILMMPVFARAALLKTSLKEAMLDGNITVDAVGSGKVFNSTGLRLTIHNNTDQAVQLTFDPALIFQPSDTSFQDLVLAGSEPVLVLAPKGKRNIEVQTFCGKSYARAPLSDMSFTYKKTR